MDIEEYIKECRDIVQQIENYDPDPYYVKYYFKNFLDLINKIINNIFKEADIRFGTFIDKYDKETFEQKARKKNDKNAIKFVEWFEKKYENSHESPYPHFIKKIREDYRCGKELELKIMLRAKERYENDVPYVMPMRLSNKKIPSRGELLVEIQKHTSIFLDLMNSKRRNNDEPQIGPKDVIASSYEAYDGIDTHVIHTFLS
jgi:hypothetical protein